MPKVSGAAFRIEQLEDLCDRLAKRGDKWLRRAVAAGWTPEQKDEGQKSVGSEGGEDEH